MDANIGWASSIGTISGMSSAGIALSQIGDDYDKDNHTFEGMPFPYMLRDILPSVGTGNLQVVVYDLTALRIWVANARAKGEKGPLEAYKRPFVEIDMKQVFDQASRLAADKAL